MKTAMINWTLLVGLVCLTPPRVNAKGANRKGNRPARAEVVATFDADGDGKLDGDERRAAGAARAAARQDVAEVGEDAGGKAVHHGGSKGTNGKGRGRGRGKRKGGKGHGGAQGANGHGGAQGVNGHGRVGRVNRAEAGQAPSDDAVQAKNNAEASSPADGADVLDDDPVGTKGRKGRGGRRGGPKGRNRRVTRARGR